MSDREEIVKILGANFEAMGQPVTPAALMLIADDLEGHSVDAVHKALARCRRELTGRLTPAAIIERLEAADGRPEPNEAWALALQTADERDSAVVNDEIAQAFGAARDILLAGDEVGARMAFLECYKRLVRDAREAGMPLTWWPSLGSDPERRASAVQRAVELKRLSRQHVADALPHLAEH